MTKWDIRFLTVAHQVATWSKDPQKSVGAVVISPDGRQVSWGYNGFPKGVADSPKRLNNRQLKNSLVVHAELNAILNAGTSVRGWTLYCTQSPCISCAMAIIQAGLTRVAVAGAPDPDSNWHGEQVAAKELLTEAQVILEYELLTPLP